MKRWRTYLILVVAVVVGLSVYRAATRRAVTAVVSDVSGKPIVGAMIQVVVIDGREAHIPEKGTFLGKSDSNGRFQIVLVNGRGKHYGILAHKDEYKPEWMMFEGYPSQEPLNLVLQADIPFKEEQYKVGDKVVARDGEWCNAEVVTMGTSSSPTSQGVRDMSGRVEVKWDDWGTTQWLLARQVRPRPRCTPHKPGSLPPISKQELADRIMGSVNNLLGR